MAVPLDPLPLLKPSLPPRLQTVISEESAVSVPAHIASLLASGDHRGAERAAVAAAAAARANGRASRHLADDVTEPAAAAEDDAAAPVAGFFASFLSSVNAARAHGVSISSQPVVFSDAWLGQDEFAAAADVADLPSPAAAQSLFLAAQAARASLLESVDRAIALSLERAVAAAAAAGAFSAAAPPRFRAYVRAVDVSTAQALVDVVPLLSPVGRVPGSAGKTRVPHMHEWVLRANSANAASGDVSGVAVPSAAAVVAVGAALAAQFNLTAAAAARAEKAGAAVALVNAQRPLLWATADFSDAAASLLAQSVIIEAHASLYSFSASGSTGASSSSSALFPSVFTQTQAVDSLWPFASSPVVHWSWSSAETVVAIKCLDAHVDAVAAGVAATATDSIDSLPTHAVHSSAADLVALGKPAAAGSRNGAGASGAGKRGGAGAATAAALLSSLGALGLGAGVPLAHRVPLLLSPRTADAATDARLAVAVSAAADASVSATAAAAGGATALLFQAPAARANPCALPLQATAGADGRVWLHALRSERSVQVRTKEG